MILPAVTVVVPLSLLTVSVAIGLTLAVAVAPPVLMPALVVVVAALVFR